VPNKKNKKTRTFFSVIFFWSQRGLGMIVGQLLTSFFLGNYDVFGFGPRRRGRGAGG